MNEFVERLKRRKLVQWCMGYLAAAFALVQGVALVADAFHWPPGVLRVTMLALGIGAFAVLVLAWYHGERGAQRVSRTESLILTLLLAGGGGALWLLEYRAPATEPALPDTASSPPTRPIVAKSIAVLPFENIGADKDNAYFADGIQEEILTGLTKIGDLKVISRTSTQHYESRPGNLPEIARQLGVASILEGSVRRVGNRARISVQLIDAVNDTHLWAETYDRTLDDLFAVQSDLARRIARSLSATLTREEQLMLATRPTANPAAYDAYLRGVAAWREVVGPINLAPVQAHFERAVRLDPDFALGWARLAITASDMYFLGEERTPARLEQARQAAEQAMRLAPDLGESHFAVGMYRYWGLNDYDGALEALDAARQRLPGNADVLAAISYVERRLGRWRDALARQQQALQLDPNNAQLLYQATATAEGLREFALARALVERLVSAVPDSGDAIAFKALYSLYEGDLDGAARELAALPADLIGMTVLEARLTDWLYRRDYAPAIAYLQARLDNAESEGFLQDMAGTYTVTLATLQQAVGDAPAAHASLLKARAMLRPKAGEDAYATLGLGEAEAALGDAAAAERLGAQALELVKTDALKRATVRDGVAHIQARLGHADAAIPLIAESLRTPYPFPLTPVDLRLSPDWDKIRDDPRFKALQEGADPASDDASVAAAPAKSANLAKCSRCQ